MYCLRSSKCHLMSASLCLRCGNWKDIIRSNIFYPHYKIAYILKISEVIDLFSDLDNSRQGNAIFYNIDIQCEITFII